MVRRRARALGQTMTAWYFYSASMSQMWQVSTDCLILLRWYFCIMIDKVRYPSKARTCWVPRYFQVSSRNPVVPANTNSLPVNDAPDRTFFRSSIPSVILAKLPTGRYILHKGCIHEMSVGVILTFHWSRAQAIWADQFVAMLCLASKAWLNGPRSGKPIPSSRFLLDHLLSNEYASFHCLSPTKTLLSSS